MKDALSGPAKVVEVGGGSENRYWMHEYLTRAVGEVRLAPNEWLAEMSQGVDDPRWRLVWAIDNELELSGKAIGTLVLGPKCPDDARETVRTRYPDLDVV